MSDLVEEGPSPGTVAPSQPARATGGVTIILVVLNVIAFIVMAIATRTLLEPSSLNLINWGADYGPLTLNGQWWRMFTSMFVHVGVVHLLFNMFVLLNIGFFMEAVLGSSSYFVLYVVSGLGSAAASLWMHPTTVSAGASGAIFGLYGGLLAFILLNRNHIAPGSLGSLTKGALVFIGYNIVFSLTRPEVDLSAHLGGLVVGFLAGLVLVVPFSRAASPERGRRKSMATAFGVGIVVVTMVALPKPGDLLGEINRMDGVEKTTLALFNSSIKNWKAGKLTTEQFEDVLEKKVLPPWRAEREALSKLQGLSEEQSKVAASLIRYMQAREDGWTLLADGIRSDDVNKVRQANQKSKEADQLAEKVGSGTK